MTTLNDAIDRYFELEDVIKKTLGWTDTWKLLPLQDERDFYWMLVGGNKITGEGSSVVLAEDPLIPFTIKMMKDGKVCGSSIYTQRHHERWVFRAENIVLIPVDTQTDGNVFLFLLDATKEVKDRALEKIYANCWGSGWDGDEDENA